MLQSMLDVDEIKPERIRGLKRREYDQLVELGVFADEKLELLRGMLVTMSPVGGVHVGIYVWLTRRLIKALDDTFEVRPASPFAASDDSEPEPDLLVCKATAPIRDDHPSEALLLIEISDSSIRKDRKVKMPLYAEAGVPEYWLFDISDDDELVISVYTEPTPTGYGKVVHMREGVLRPLHLPIEIAIADIPR